MDKIIKFLEEEFGFILKNRKYVIGGYNNEDVFLISPRIFFYVGAQVSSVRINGISRIIVSFKPNRDTISFWSTGGEHMILYVNEIKFIESTEDTISVASNS
jgi:hypothetical protein